MEGAGEDREPRAALFPRVIRSVRREDRPSATEQRTSHTEIDPPLGISVALQTDTSWLHEHSLQKSVVQTSESVSPPTTDLPAMTEQEEDLYSSLSEDLSELSILCDMEFSSDYKTYFQQHLKTLTSVGPPTIMAYKRESSENDRLLAIMQILKDQSVKELCEFCGKPLKPFPLEYTTEKERSEEMFCCRQFKNKFQYLFKEQKQLLKKEKVEMISIAPHQPFGSDVERQKAKEKTAQRLRERHMANVFHTVITEPEAVTEYGKPMKTISYQLSGAPPVGDNWTIAPEHPDSIDGADTLDNELSLYDFTNEMIMPERFVEKYYRTGRKFLTMFPDGSAQIFYPSGNLAIIVIPIKLKESIYIVQEDKEHSADILAVFASSGKATCYHPNRTVWINMNPVGGQCSDSTGRKVRRWRWKSSDSGEPYAEFKPIYLSLNHQVGVRIFAQDRMYVTFLAMGKQAKFRVGRKELTSSQVAEIEADVQLQKVSPDEMILFAIKIKFLTLLNKCHGCLEFSSKKQWERVRPPSFLVAQAQKLIYLCSVGDISIDECSAIREILADHVTSDIPN
ncbi:glutamate-rich protein 6 isoform X2 [Pseudophryne corroboree]|uniref:glutamate-rich protein 6 isoform X2 n=1 Tax=Pseudophryne corroboree TaxID=495146 RepID=UPI00308126FA